jgi:FkbM family methyltransferase
MISTHRLNGLRHYYHAFKAGLRERLQPRNLDVRLPGGSRFIIPRKDEIAERIFRGTYEAGVRRFMSKVLKPGMTAFDLGAHCGYFTLVMREAVGMQGEVHSFEPSPRTYRRLLTNIGRNKFANVSATEAALAAKEGTLTFHSFTGERAAYSTLGHPPFPDSKQIEVRTTTLDHYATLHSISRIDLLKMDVEGAELDVLHGAHHLLETHALKALIFEVNDAWLKPRGTSSAALLAYLRELGYLLYDLDEDGHPTPLQQQLSYDYTNLVAVAPGIQFDGDAS